MNYYKALMMFICINAGIIIVNASGIYTISGSGANVAAYAGVTVMSLIGGAVGGGFLGWLAGNPSGGAVAGAFSGTFISMMGTNAMTFGSWAISLDGGTAGVATTVYGIVMGIITLIGAIFIMQIIGGSVKHHV